MPHLTSDTTITTGSHDVKVIGRTVHQPQLISLTVHSVKQTMKSTAKGRAHIAYGNCMVEKIIHVKYVKRVQLYSRKLSQEYAGVINSGYKLILDPNAMESNVRWLIIRPLTEKLITPL